MDAGCGDSNGELFLGRLAAPRCTLPGALLDPAGSMCCRYAGVMQRMPTSRLTRRGKAY